MKQLTLGRSTPCCGAAFKKGRRRGAPRAPPGTESLICSKCGKGYNRYNGGSR